MRLIFFFGITAYSYVGKREGSLTSPLGKMAPGSGVGSGVGELVCNSFVFTWGFVELLGWFWVSGVFFLFVLGWKPG